MISIKNIKSSACSFLPPAYVVRWEGNVLTCVCLCACPHGGGVPHPAKRGYPYPAIGVLPSSQKGISPSSQKGVLPPCHWGYPPRSAKRGYPHPANRGGGTPIQVTCYVAGGMPLAFTQEDFLVSIFLRRLFVGETRNEKHNQSTR